VTDRGKALNLDELDASWLRGTVYIVHVVFAGGGVVEWGEQWIAY